MTQVENQSRFFQHVFSNRLRDNACTTLLPVLLVSANCVSALALDLVTSPRDDEAGDYGRDRCTQTSTPNWSYLNIVMHTAVQPRHFQQYAQINNKSRISSDWNRRSSLSILIVCRRLILHCANDRQYTGEVVRLAITADDVWMFDLLGS